MRVQGGGSSAFITHRFQFAVLVSKMKSNAVSEPVNDREIILGGDSEAALI